MNEFGRHGLIDSDSESYSSRTDVDQHELQQVRVDVCEQAAGDAGLDRSGWDIQQGGDGELAVLPRNQLMTSVIDELPESLCDALTTHNSTARPAMRLRMRMAMHEGMVRPAAGGFAGTGVVTVSRMVASSVARQALIACPEANLVVLLSTTLYNEYVRQGHTAIPAERFRKVAVSVKKFNEAAWLYVPRYDVHSLNLDDAPPPADRPAANASVANQHATTITNVQGNITGDRHVFGVSYQNNR
ncbi:hypothetical protein V5P93_000712 [Actinokineospora auranticolor]|uniref:Guanylate cyclase domain-containing protein n=1 Tax=Actinokineospora auranticolor TaxID=155976 RepID=A0A2S6GZ11_9PSEU|nr:hypothetical protein [Actinokineospora auranticolor]PPK70407.1 hypothetical protein CLV40_102322 [Actinokineospora auranticolor]